MLRPWIYMAAGAVHGVYMRAVNILITVTKVRKIIIKSIPISLQNAIGGGIGVFVAYNGLLNVNIIGFDAGIPAIATFNNPVLWLFLIGLVLILVLLILNVRGAVLIGIVATAILGIPMGVTKMAESISFSEACAALPTTFGVIFTSEGLPSLFNDMSKLPLVLITIFSFSVSDTFDTLGNNLSERDAHRHIQRGRREGDGIRLRI